MSEAVAMSIVNISVRREHFALGVARGKRPLELIEPRTKEPYWKGSVGVRLPPLGRHLEELEVAPAVDDQEAALDLTPRFAPMLVGCLRLAAGTARKTPEGISALASVFSLLPITFYVMAVAFIWTFPITPEVQKRIRRLVERRAARAATRKAQTPAQ